MRMAYQYIVRWHIWYYNIFRDGAWSFISRWIIYCYGHRNEFYRQ